MNINKDYPFLRGITNLNAIGTKERKLKKHLKILKKIRKMRE